MIGINELRTGNWLYYTSIFDPEFNTKENLDLYKVDIIKVAIINSIYGTVYDNEDFIMIPDYLYPIPLTREILYTVPFETLSVGSRETSYWQPYKPDIDFTLTWYVSDERIEWEERTIKYVHQLQNLYFALTGEELHIEL